jgi:threonine/homoserine/homoserine lactone efflux protein
MNVLISLLTGFATAFIGITPQLLNMTAAKVNLKEGKRNAIWFVLGAIIIIFSSLL